MPLINLFKREYSLDGEAGVPVGLPAPTRGGRAGPPGDAAREQVLQGLDVILKQYISSYVIPFRMCIFVKSKAL